jgi:pimeloyl-ACP methyl ester carboxylesterase
MSDDSIDKREHYVALPSGVTLHVTEWGRTVAAALAPPILLIHGLGDAAPVWRDVAVALARRTRVLAVDLPGHGESSWRADADYGVTAMAADIGLLMHALSLANVTAVGHSMGGSVALRVASRYPERVERLVLADSGPDADSGSTALLRGALREAHRLYAAVENYAAVLSARHPLACTDLLQWVAAATTRRLSSGSIELKYDPEILAGLERAETPTQTAARHAETWRLLAGLHCPVLVLRGAASSILSARIATKMAQEVLECPTLRVIPLSGHSIQLDNPKAVSAAIEQFLRADRSGHRQGGRQQASQQPISR